MLAAVSNHLWQSTIFAGAIALLALAFRRNRAQVRYALWLSASSKFLVPFALLISLGSAVDWKPVAATLPAPAVSIAVTQISEPFPSAVSFVPEASRTRDWRPFAVPGVWLAGFAVVACIRLRGWLRVREAVRASTRFDVSSGVEIRSVPGLMEPGVVGWRRPVLLLPEKIGECLTPAQLQAVLAHELSHIRRRDNLTAALHMLVEAVFWFHPLVWWIGARLVEERERACDEAVLRLGNVPRDYAAAILEVCRLYMESPLACVSGVTGSDLKKRIHTILAGSIVAELSAFRKVVLALAGAVALAAPFFAGMMSAPVSRAQGAASSGPKFDVASIRLCKDGSGRGDTKRGPAGGSATFALGRLNTGCALLAGTYPLAGLIQRAYGRLGLGRIPAIGSAQPISGGPSWIYSDYYVIKANAPESTSRATMEGPMLQALLEDRFHLKLRRETRQVPVYALTVAKGGPKLQRFVEGSCVAPDFSQYPLPKLPDGQRYCKNAGVGGRRGVNTFFDQDGITLEYFCKLLGLVMDRPLIDRTGLTGKYDIHLEFAIDQSTTGVGPAFDGQSAEGTPAPSIFVVVQEQLGLKLEATKAPREFLVIDHVERPTEN